MMLSLSFSYNVFPGYESGFVWASWTIGVEMIFYALFPLLKGRVNCWKEALIFLLVTIVIAAFWERMLVLLVSDPLRGSFSNFSFFRHLPSFAVGMLVFFIYEKYIEDKRIDMVNGWLLLACWLLLYSGLSSGLVAGFIDRLYWQGVMFSFLILGLLVTPCGFFVNRLTEFWGERSYSMYLLHPLVVIACLPLTHWLYRQDMPTTVKYLASFGLVLLVVSLTADRAYKWIEKPGMRLGKKFIK